MTTSISAIRDDIKESDIERIVARCQVERTRYIEFRNKFKRSVCGACAHSEVDEINRRILMQVPLSTIKEQYSLSENVVDRHWHYHVRPLIMTVMPPADGPGLNKHLALMMRKRATAPIPRSGLRRQLEYVLVDMMLMRRLAFGNIAEDGLVIEAPSVSAIVAIDKTIIAVAEKLHAIAPQQKLNMKAQRSISDDLVPKDQQREIDNALALSKEARENGNREADEQRTPDAEDDQDAD